MVIIDKIIAALSPARAVERARSRIQLKSLERLYDVAQPSNFHTKPRDNRSADGVIDQSRSSLRDFARHLDENHDIAIGVLDTLVDNIVGAKGIQIEPSVKTKGGKLNKKANETIRRAFKEWSRRADTSKTYGWGELQRHICRTWLRDGDLLIQNVIGNAPTIKYPTNIKYAIELIEGDYLPFEKNNDANPRIVHGVEMNEWKEPTGYHVLKQHPGDTMFLTGYNQDTKRVPAKDITFLKFTRRLGQTRGVSVLHGVINRLDDLKDYHESERIAARVAAAFTGYIKRNTDFSGNVANTTGDRSYEMEPGMIWTDLLPGEEVGTIASNRPSPQFGEFTKDNQRAIASGVGASYSSISKRYEGNYSSQRQELVESRPGYEKMTNYLISNFYDPTYRNFIDMLLVSGEYSLPKNIDPASLYDYEARGPAMVWIDPVKEVDAKVKAIEAKLKSRSQAIRDSGDDPAVVNEQIEMEFEQDQKRLEAQQAATGTNNQETENKPNNNDEPNNDQAATG